MKKISSLTFLSTILVLSLFCFLGKAQNNAHLDPKETKEIKGTLKTQDLLEKINLSKFPTPLYFQYVGNDGVSLDSLVKDALAYNKEIIALRQRRDILQARRVQAGLKPNPRVEIGFLTDSLSNRDGEYDFSATYSQLVERGNKRANRVRVVDLEIEQLEKEIGFQEQKLRLDLLTEYINTLSKTQHLQLLEKLVSLSEENLKLVQVRFKEGDAAKLDLQLSELELNRWKIQMLQAELQVKANLTQIRFLVGLETSFPLKLKNYNPVFELKQDILELQNLALENRLDLQVARINEDIAQATVNLTKSRAKNDIELFARYQEERKTENNVLGNFSNIERKIGGGISFTLPFYNRGQGNIAESIANKTQTTYLREQLEQRIKQDVTLALAQFINAQESLKLFEAYILPKAESNLKILQVAYQLGEQDLTDVISEQRKFIESQKEYLNAQREYSLSLIALERAVGKSLN